jgi:hypothetical protein
MGDNLACQLLKLTYDSSIFAYTFYGLAASFLLRKLIGRGLGLLCFMPRSTYIDLMQQALITQFEAMLPSIRAGNVPFPEFPILAEPDQKTKPLQVVHRQIARFVDDCEEQMAFFTSMIEMSDRLDRSLCSAGPTAIADGSITLERLNRMSSTLETKIVALELAVAELYDQYVRIGPGLTKGAKTLRKMPVFEAHRLARDIDLALTAFASICDATRDMVLGMKLVKSRLDVLFNGPVTVIQTKAELDSFLESCWS